MKTFYKIVIVILIALAVYIAKDEIRIAFNGASSYFKKDIQIPIVKFAEEEKIKFDKKVDMPGALRVVNDVISGNNNIQLSRDNIIKYTNLNRKENGNLLNLNENSKLDLSAEKKVKDMFDKKYFEHISPDGIAVGDLGDQVGYDYIIIGENLAMGNFKDDKVLVSAWMNSPGHRANILNARYTEIGVAVSKGVFDGKNVWIAVQHFGTPSSICPSVDKVLYGIIEINQKEIDTMQKDLSVSKDNIDKMAIFEGNTYFEQVNKYNDMIAVYNNLIDTTKQKIETYNKQVNAFNLCLANNQ